MKGLNITNPHTTRADEIYAQIKEAIFNFEILPGDRFTETAVAKWTNSSRTPVRQALYQLQRDNFVDVHSRLGWRVLPINFDIIDERYEIRILLELEAIQRLCQMQEPSPILQELNAIWLVDVADRETDFASLYRKDERFHEMLVEAAGNSEMAKIHHDITEKIRIVRRLDFTQKSRVDATYKEHGEILTAIKKGDIDKAKSLLAEHITQSKLAVRKITLETIQKAQKKLGNHP